MNHLTETQLNLFLDEALSPAESAQAAAHLALCPACRTELERLRRVFTVLDGLSDRRLDRDLSPDILSELAPRESPPLGWSLALAVQGGVALGVVITLCEGAALSLASASYWDALWRQSLQASTGIIYAAYSFTFPTIAVPGFSLPRIALPWNAAEIGIVAAAAALLWIVGNASLLRSRPEGRR